MIKNKMKNISQYNIYKSNLYEELHAKSSIGHFAILKDIFVIMSFIAFAYVFYSVL